MNLPRTDRSHWTDLPWSWAMYKPRTCSGYVREIIFFHDKTTRPETIPENILSQNLSGQQLTPCTWFTCSSQRKTGIKIIRSWRGMCNAASTFLSIDCIVAVVPHLQYFTTACGISKIQASKAGVYADEPMHLHIQGNFPGW